MPDPTNTSSAWTRFTAKAELVGAVVMRAGSEDSVSSLLRSTAAEFHVTASVAERFPRAASSLGMRETKPEPARADGEPNAEVVAVAGFAIAETGSVALDEPAGDRGACFLAERLWLLVSERDIVDTLDEGMQRMRELVGAGARHPLLMTGPSRTADIERVLTIGVHGPRALAVVVIGAS